MFRRAALVGTIRTGEPSRYSPPSRRQGGIQCLYEFIEFGGRSIDVQERVVRIGREEQSEPVWPDFKMRIVMGIRSGHVHARKVDFDVRHDHDTCATTRRQMAGESGP